MNRFLSILENGRFAVGSHISFCDSTISELIGSAGFDYLWIDTEHTAMSLQDVQQHLIAAKASGSVSLVRVSWNDPVRIKPVLEMGPDGIIIPQVNSLEEAKAAVAACRYPPKGIRGFGPRRAVMYGVRDTNDYLHHVDEELAVVLQVEHINAVRDFDEILKVEGITAFVIGPCDLAASMGYIDDPFNSACIEVEKEVIKKANAAGIPIGMSVGKLSMREVSFWKEVGLNFISLEGDAQFIAFGAMSLFAQLDQIR